MIHDITLQSEEFKQIQKRELTFIIMPADGKILNVGDVIRVRNLCAPLSPINVVVGRSKYLADGVQVVSVCGVEHSRQSPYERIQDAAVELTKQGGLSAITRDKVAGIADITPSLLYHYFDSIEALRTRVVEIAVDTEDAELLLHGIKYGHKLATDAPNELKEKALGLLTNEVMGG